MNRRLRGGPVLWWMIALAGLPGAARAYCAGFDTPDKHYYSVNHEYLRSDFVASVIVRRETWLGEDGKPAPLKPPFQMNMPRPWGFDPYVGVVYDVELVTAYKGRPPRRFKLWSENSTGRFWMKPGERYLIFTSRWGYTDFGMTNVQSIDNCGNSNLLDRAPNTLRLVRKWSSRR